MEVIALRFFLFLGLEGLEGERAFVSACCYYINSNDPVCCCHSHLDSIYMSAAYVRAKDGIIHQDGHGHMSVRVPSKVNRDSTKWLYQLAFQNQSHS